MKKIILSLIAMLPFMANAQEQKAMYESKSYDNWYIGVNGGLSTKTTHSHWMDNANLNGGFRVGRWFTPAFGFAFESNAYLGDKPQPTTGTIVKYVNTDLAATINLSNWWFGYHGEPRFFEVIAVPGIGMGHVFGNRTGISQQLNDFTGKVALDFAFNVDKKKCVQLYLEPAMLYSIHGNTCNSDAFNLNVNRSHFQLNIGLIYKFKNTNGSHNFRYAENYGEKNEVETVDQSYELERLNTRIAELQAENEELKNHRGPNIAPRIITKEISTLQPVIVFRQNSSRIPRNEYADIENVAKFLKNNPDVTVTICGYASTEGKEVNNQTLSEKRAEAVKTALIERYGISEGRITVKGKGATDKQSEELQYNRVVTFTFSE